MTELRSAEEWQVEFWERCARAYWKDPEVRLRGHGTEVECAVIRDIQRNALETAEDAIQQCEVRGAIALSTREACFIAVRRLTHSTDPAQAEWLKGTAKSPAPAGPKE